MKVSARGREDIALSEGIRTTAYRDSVGVWTIGIGHTASAGPPAPKAGMTLTRAEVMALFVKDIAKFEARVTKALGEVPQHVFDGAVSFDYNTGGIDKASWVAAYKRGDMAEARRRFMLWNKPSEIIGRRKREAVLIFDGKYATSGSTVPIDKSPAPPAPDRKDIIREAQAALDALGYTPGPIDGIEGKMTKAATLAYQKAKPELGDDGIIGPQTLASLRADVALLKAVTPVPLPADDDDWVLVDSDHLPVPPQPDNPGPAPDLDTMRELEAGGFAGPVLVFVGIVAAIVAAVFVISRIAG